MSFSHPLDWVRSLQPDFNDRRSFTIMRDIAERNLAKDTAIRDEIVAAHGEEVARAEWDPGMAEDAERYREAIRLIDERVAELEKQPPACRTPDCPNDPTNGEGWNGYCGSCADQHEERLQHRFAESRRAPL